MRQVLHDAKQHWLASSVFLSLWAAAYILHVVRWRAPLETGDMAPPVFFLHLSLPVIAGALVAWWHGPHAGRALGGMMAGAAVAAVDGVLLAGHDAVAYGGGEIGFSLEAVGFFILFGVAGAVLGGIGGGGAAILSGEPVQETASAAPMRESLLRAGALLAFAVAALVLFAVIPPVRADYYPGATPERAATAFAICAVLNVYAGLALLVAAWRPGSRWGRPVAVTAALLVFVLAVALLDATGALDRRHHLQFVQLACGAGALTELAAGLLALRAAAARR